MSRKDLLKHLRRESWELLREGRGHSVWINPANQQQSAIPRHREISDYTQGAVASAMRDVQTAGLAVERVMIDAASFPSTAVAELPAAPPIYRFSIAELMAAVTAIAVGLAFPVILPCVAVLLLIRLGVGLLKSVFLAILAATMILLRFAPF